jgi:methylenetetrahydrofolate--tRNA-(uracil-5-)-methyltransferase
MACRARSLAEAAAFSPPPRTTALGSLVHYITHADAGNYEPANISFDLLAPLEGLPKNAVRDRRARRNRQCDRALTDLKPWLESVGGILSAPSRLLTTDPGRRTSDSMHG